MPVKRKSSRNGPKLSRNVKINSKRPKRASQKKRGRSGRGRKSQRGGETCGSNKYDDGCRNLFCPSQTQKKTWATKHKQDIFQSPGFFENYVKEHYFKPKDKEFPPDKSGNSGEQTYVGKIIDRLAVELSTTNVPYVADRVVKVPRGSNEGKELPTEDLQAYLTRKLNAFDSAITSSIHKYLLGTKENPNDKIGCFFSPNPKNN